MRRARPHFSFTLLVCKEVLYLHSHFWICFILEHHDLLLKISYFVSFFFIESLVLLDFFDKYFCLAHFVSLALGLILNFIDFLLFLLISFHKSLVLLLELLDDVLLLLKLVFNVCHLLRIGERVFRSDSFFEKMSESQAFIHVCSKFKIKFLYLC